MPLGCGLAVIVYTAHKMSFIKNVSQFDMNQIQSLTNILSELLDHVHVIKHYGIKS